MPRTDAAAGSAPVVDPPDTPDPTDDARDAETEAILRRLRSVEGHVRGVERMVADGAYCMDVMNQILAIERALEKVSGMVLDRHLHTCVTRALRGDDPDERERVIDEVMEVFQASARR